MIKAVVFDCFGVLVSESWSAFKIRYFGRGSEAFQKATHLMDLADSGTISHEQFLERVARLAGLSVKEVQTLLDTNVADEELLDYIAGDLKPHYKIGLLSNAAANWLELFFTKEQLSLFDVISLSYETGIIKPDPRAFQYLADEMHFQLNEIIFVDDQVRHLISARELGMKTVLYQNFEQGRRDLEQILAA